MKVRNKLDHILIVGTLRLKAGEEVEIPEVNKTIKYAIAKGLLEEIKEDTNEVVKDEKKSEKPKTSKEKPTKEKQRNK